MKRSLEKPRTINTSFCGTLRLCLIAVAVFGVSLFINSCAELKAPIPEEFVSVTMPPPQQEFRWSNGKMPKSIDPAKAAAPPETDIVRAIYEGLTDVDPKTLKAIPAVAEKWEASEDKKTWTFTLRKDAKWTNGESVTAKDFVASWKRLADPQTKAAHKDLLRNIADIPDNDDVVKDDLLESISSQHDDAINVSEPTPTPQPTATSEMLAQPTPTPTPRPLPKLNITAEGDHVLKVVLKVPDPDFPALVANPIFRPIFNAENASASLGQISLETVTNGAFRLSSIEDDGIVAVRNAEHREAADIKLEKVKFVAMESAEKALNAYRNGEIDALTNADFEPLALKLLRPYEDFKASTHGALNIYEFNRERQPFNDRNVRQALAIGIERAKVADGDLEGTTRPANSFMPFERKDSPTIVEDVRKAGELLDKAGFTDRSDFPVVKLLINRNDTQNRVAKTVARMWKENLGIETDIVEVDGAKIDEAREQGDYDIVRRGVVLPTSDETANFLAIFGSSEELTTSKVVADDAETDDETAIDDAETQAEEHIANQLILTEDQALFDMRAFPLYYPISTSLVKPYVIGFEPNILDSPSLRSVVINNYWQPMPPK